MLKVGHTIASAAGLRTKKKFHFEVTFCLQDLLNCTYITGVLFAKIRLKDGGSYADISRRQVAWCGNQIPSIVGFLSSVG